MSNRVTRSDVARQAGVSLMTVSRVINNKGDVSNETRRRILEIISDLGYRPSGIARSLATRETYTIGLVVPDVSNPSALVSPTLTTCRVPRYELGAKAVNALLERLQDCPGECNQTVLQPELVIRESAP